MSSPLSAAAAKAVAIAMGDNPTAQEVCVAVNNGNALALISGASIALAIVATSTSTTLNFAALAVGDLVMVLPASAGNSHFVLCATAGTLPEAAVNGSLYVALRQLVLPAATAAVAVF